MARGRNTQRSTGVLRSHLISFPTFGCLGGEKKTVSGVGSELRILNLLSGKVPCDRTSFSFSKSTGPDPTAIGSGWGEGHGPPEKTERRSFLDLTVERKPKGLTLVFVSLGFPSPIRVRGCRTRDDDLNGTPVLPNYQKFTLFDTNFRHILYK